MTKLTLIKDLICHRRREELSGLLRKKVSRRKGKERKEIRNKREKRVRHSWKTNKKQ